MPVDFFLIVSRRFSSMRSPLNNGGVDGIGGYAIVGTCFTDDISRTQKHRALEKTMGYQMKNGEGKSDHIVAEHAQRQKESEQGGYHADPCRYSTPWKADENHSTHNNNYTISAGIIGNHYITFPAFKT